MGLGELVEAFGDEAFARSVVALNFCGTTVGDEAQSDRTGCSHGQRCAQRSSSCLAARQRARDGRDGVDGAVNDYVHCEDCRQGIEQRFGRCRDLWEVLLDGRGKLAEIEGFQFGAGQLRSTDGNCLVEAEVLHGHRGQRLQHLFDMLRFESRDVIGGSTTLGKQQAQIMLQLLSTHRRNFERGTFVTQQSVQAFVLDRSELRRFDFLNAELFRGHIRDGQVIGFQRRLKGVGAVAPAVDNSRPEAGLVFTGLQREEVRRVPELVGKALFFFVVLLLSDVFNLAQVTISVLAQPFGITVPVAFRRLSEHLSHPLGLALGQVFANALGVQLTFQRRLDRCQFRVQQLFQLTQTPRVRATCGQRVLIDDLDELAGPGRTIGFVTNAGEDQTVLLVRADLEDFGHGAS